MGKEARRQHGRILHPIMNLGDVNGLNKDKTVVREKWMDSRMLKEVRLTRFCHLLDGEREEDLSIKCSTWHSSLAIVPLSLRESIERRNAWVQKL